MTSGCPNSRKGFILIAVLMISLLFLSAAVSFAWFARTQMRRVSDEEFALKARTLAVIALGEVSEWISGDTNEFDSMRELLYYPDLPLVLPFDDWQVNISITPQDAMLPLNYIFLPDGVTVRNEYEHAWDEVWNLLKKNDTGMIVLDFLDGDTEARAGGLEEDYFPNKKISDLSELLLLSEDITPELLYGGPDSGDVTISKYFTVYGGEKININFAPREVLLTLDQDLWPNMVDAIIAYREEENITGAKDLLNIPGFPSTVTTRLNNILGYKSDYFLVRLGVMNGEREHNFVIMMKRGGDKCQIINWRE
jgi:type II secretory pathway component PulK